MRRAASQRLTWMLALLISGVLTVGTPGQTEVTLPTGIQESGSLSQSQRDALEAFINQSFETLKTGTITQQRAARDQLLEMFDVPSVSTAFRLAATNILASHLDESVSSTNRWIRFAGFRIAARLASEDSGRIFIDAINSSDDAKKGDMLMALGQLRVLFLEADRGGLAISPDTFTKLASAVSKAMAEEDDPDIALLEARALRALAQSLRPELVSVRDAAASALASAVATRLESKSSVSLGSGSKAIDELLVSLEATDAIRGYLVLRSPADPMDTAVARDLARLAGQTLAFVTRSYERTPVDADAVRRYLQRLAQRGLEITGVLIASHNAAHPADQVDVSALPAPDSVAHWLANGEMQKVKLTVIQILETLAQINGFDSDWAKID